MAKGKTNYIAGCRFFKFQKELDYRHEQIDARSERDDEKSVNLNPVETNESGRVWSF